MPVSDYLIRSFRTNDLPNRGPVLDAVREAGFSIEYIDEDFKTPAKWGLFLKPSRSLSELFRLDREVLLWCTTYPSFQARDIEHIKTLITKHGVRLTRNFAILVSRYDPQSRSRLEAESTLDTTIVHCSIEELASRSEKRPALLGILLDRLYTRDLYDLPVATTRSADFFGRRSMIDDLADEITSGQSQIGVFGLRKIGKTSLMNRLADVVRQSGRCLVVKIDLQWTTSIDPRSDYTLWSLGEALFASSRIVRNVKGLRLFGQYATSSDLSARGISVWDEFRHDLMLTMQTTNRRIVIIFDEIERIFRVPDKEEFIRLWRFLRGFDQQFQGRLRFLVSGTSPECVEAAVLGDQDNPLYQYLSIHYLGPLAAEDSRELLKGLGGPIGLIWSEQALLYAYQQTGGHPALLRTLGSIIHNMTLPRTTPINVGRGIAAQAAERLMTTHTAVLSYITAALEDQYSDEFVMLKMLADAQLSSFRQLASTYPDELSHLSGYGLLPAGGDSSSLSIGFLQAYLQARSSHVETEAAESPAAAIGELIGTRRLVSLIKSGGFADVFLAEDEDGSRCAVKIFRGARMSALEREVEYLQALDHPGIVRFLEATQTLNGKPCLVMEYLEGRTLADRCNATAAPDLDELIEISEKILDALVYMHPDVAGATRLAKKGELSAKEFETWERLRLGVVHRDIKPENIILTQRGPVLIDFNIAVRAAAPVRTMSATAGYLPPDFNGLSWTADVDIYQLGVTLAQLAAAAAFDGENLPDLLTLAKSRHGEGLGSWLESMTSENRSESAMTLKAQLKQLATRHRKDVRG